MPDPLTSLLAAALIAGTGLLVFWPERGLYWRWQHARRTTERVLIEDALKHVHESEMEGRQATVQSLAGALNVADARVAELLEQMDRPIDVFCASVGTAGLAMGVSGALHDGGSSTKVVIFEPDTTPVISGGEAGSHHVEGIGIGFLPPLLDRERYDEVRSVRVFTPGGKLLTELDLDADTISGTIAILAWSAAGTAVATAWAAVSIHRLHRLHRLDLVGYFLHLGFHYLGTSLLTVHAFKCSRGWCLFSTP